MQPDTQMYHVRFKLLLYFRVTSGSQPTPPCILTGPIAAQIGQHKRKIKGLESLQHVTFSCIEQKETVELPAGHFVRAEELSSSPVMYWHPPVEGTVPVSRMDVERRSVKKTRPMAKGHVYAVGGLNGNRDLSSVERYDEEKNEWEAVASMGTRRQGLGACVLGRRLYAVGGYDGNRRLSCVERYDEEKNEWEAVADMGSARGGVGVCVLGGRMYAVGGKDADGNFLASVERYDEAKNEWEAVVDMGTARSFAGVASTGEVSVAGNVLQENAASLDD